jgi:hypothetical protein
MKHTTSSWLLGLGLWAVIGLAQGAERFSYSGDGTEVTDNATGLIWKRCPEGMTWVSNTCTGPAAKYAHQEALQHAQTQASAGWRLPNVKELSSIADRSRANPAIDPTAFPNTPSDRFWSSSPYVGSSSNAWFVHFSSGSVYGSYDRINNYYVRLVR